MRPQMDVNGLREFAPPDGFRDFEAERLVVSGRSQKMKDGALNELSIGIKFDDICL